MDRRLVLEGRMERPGCGVWSVGRCEMLQDSVRGY